MASAHDVAAHILQQCGSMSAMKLQKLVYYCQAWHLVWEDEPLFPEQIEAWAAGPVVPALYQQHRGKFTVDSWLGKPLRDEEAETVQVVLANYGEFNAHQLSELTHREAPWIKARRGLAPGERGNREISHEDMATYYGSLVD